jgi:hypothetical protein
MFKFILNLFAHPMHCWAGNYRRSCNVKYDDICM